jgi:proteasome lid subunit RPN8/RPN11
MTRVILKKDDYRKMLEHARELAPEEACGLLAGTEEKEESGLVRTVRKVYLLTNTDHSREHFSLDPKEQLAAVKDMRESGWKPLGNWHSHPASPSRSSEEDIRLAFDKNASYLILSLMDRENPVLHSFHVENGISTQEELIIAD